MRRIVVTAVTLCVVADRAATVVLLLFLPPWSQPAVCAGNLSTKYRMFCTSFLPNLTTGRLCLFASEKPSCQQAPAKAAAPEGGDGEGGDDGAAGGAAGKSDKKAAPASVSRKVCAARTTNLVAMQITCMSDRPGHTSKAVVNFSWCEFCRACVPLLQTFFPFFCFIASL